MVVDFLLRTAMAKLAGACARVGDPLCLLFSPFALALWLLFGTAKRTRPSPRLAAVANGGEAVMQLCCSSA